MHHRQGPPGPAQDHRTKGIYQVGAPQHRHHRRGPGRHRQDLSGGGRRRLRLPGQAGQPHHPHPPGGGGRRAPGLFARRPSEQGGSLPAAAVRRPLRHAGGGDVPEVPGAGQHRGGASGLYAGPHPGRQLHHPGRGSEYLPGADEDVFDPPWLRVQDRHHR